MTTPSDNPDATTPSQAPAPRVARKGPFAPLRHRNFALVWTAALVSNLGTWMQTVALGALITELTGQARWAGIVAAAGFLPLGLLGPVGGALADRLDRRRFLLSTISLQAVFAVALAVLVATDHASPWPLTVLVFFGDGIGGIGFPAYQALMPDLVPPEDLAGAVSLSAAQWNLGRVLGPAAAGLAIGWGGYSLAFILNAASFGVMAVALLALQLREHVRASGPLAIGQRMRAGWNAAIAEPGCRLAIQSIAVVSILPAPFIALIPAVARKVHGGDETLISALVTAQGVGAVAAAFSQTSLAARFGRPNVLIGSALGVGPALVAYGIAPSPAAAVIALALVGFFYLAVFAGLNTVVQLRAAPEFRARVLSIYMVTLGILYPLAAIAQGALADRIGLREVTAGSGIVFLAAVVAVVSRRHDLATVLGDNTTPQGASLDRKPTLAQQPPSGSTALEAEQVVDT